MLPHFLNIFRLAPLWGEFNRVATLIDNFSVATFLNIFRLARLWGNFSMVAALIENFSVATFFKHFQACPTFRAILIGLPNLKKKSGLLLFFDDFSNATLWGNFSRVTTLFKNFRVAVIFDDFKVATLIDNFSVATFIKHFQACPTFRAILVVVGLPHFWVDFFKGCRTNFLQSLCFSEPLVLEDHPSQFFLPEHPEEPEFADSETNVTAQLGGAVFLHCPVVNSGDRAVSYPSVSTTLQLLISTASLFLLFLFFHVV